MLGLPSASSAFSRGLLLFWSLWLSVVSASNLADGLQQMGALPSPWRFASGNFALVVEAIEIYGMPRSLAAVLFVGVVTAQLGASLLFWRAFLDRDAASTRHHPKVSHAFSAAGGIFASFLVADEVLIIYARLPAIETTHFLVLCALLLSFVAISTLDDPPPSDGQSM